MKLKLFFSLALLVITMAACSKSKSGTLPPKEPVTPVDTSLQKLMPFPFGAAVNISRLKNNATYRNVVIKEYNSLTAENSMKAASLHPQPDVYDWNDADYLVNFATENNKRVHGHTLIWHKSLPSWMTNFQGDSVAWENMFKTHIQTIVFHFKGKVKSWDVVNEAIADDGTLRSSIWLEKLGSGYIARAFKYAHEADPDALLFYNDYGHEYGATKRRQGILNLVNSLVAEKVPVHGMGLQMHTRYNIADDNLVAAITTAAATGLKIHIAELDIALNPDNNPNLVYTTALGNEQAKKYRLIVQTFNAIPKVQQHGITTWNVGDADSWIPTTYNRPDWPLPFDNSYKRKPAYYAIINAVK